MTGFQTLCMAIGAIVLTLFGVVTLAVVIGFVTIIHHSIKDADEYEDDDL